MNQKKPDFQMTRVGLIFQFALFISLFLMFYFINDKYVNLFPIGILVMIVGLQLISFFQFEKEVEGSKALLLFSLILYFLHLLVCFLLTLKEVIGMRGSHVSVIIETSISILFFLFPYFINPFKIKKNLNNSSIPWKSNSFKRALSKGSTLFILFIISFCFFISNGTQHFIREVRELKIFGERPVMIDDCFSYYVRGTNGEGIFKIDHYHFRTEENVILPSYCEVTNLEAYYQGKPYTQDIKLSNGDEIELRMTIDESLFNNYGYYLAEPSKLYIVSNLKELSSEITEDSSK